MLLTEWKNCVIILFLALQRRTAQMQTNNLSTVLSRRAHFLRLLSIRAVFESVLLNLLAFPIKYTHFLCYEKSTVFVNFIVSSFHGNSLLLKIFFDFFPPMILFHWCFCDKKQHLIEYDFKADPHFQLLLIKNRFVTLNFYLIIISTACFCRKMHHVNGNCR